jgi:N-acetylmuramoyl-L-alanine amidase
MGMRTILGMLTLLLLAAWPGAAAAQQGEPSWSFESGSRSTTVSETRVRGYAAVPLSALTGVGASITVSGDETRVRIGDREARLIAGLPFFQMDGTGRQLARPAYRESGVLFVPVQFLVEFLPELAGDALEIDAERRIVRRSAGAPARAEAGATAPTPRPAEAVEAERRRLATWDGPALVVIDAGHGGVDPGARGPGGTREKDVTLAVARRLAQLLRENPDYNVRMTRDADTLIALRDRSRLANGWRGDGQPALFISIHANAANSRSAHGFETYFLSEALTEDARRVAAMENAAQRFESPDRSDMDPLSFILHDLRQNRYLHESSHYASLVQRRLGEIHPGPNRGVKQAGFVVLNGAFMPAVLVELGFISNPSEERMLADPDHQMRFAQQLARSVDDYFASAR